MPKYKKLSRPSEEANRLISESIAKRVASLFPVDGNFFRLDVSNIEVELGSSDINSVKKALVSGSSINNRVKATVTLFDKQSHKKIDTKRRVIMTIPSFTKKGSFVIEGNSYVIPFQQRLRAGVYTMKKRNGAIETMFNLGKGRNFTIKLAGETFAIKVGSAHVSLYSILHFIGVSDNRMRKVWGDGMFEVNQKTYKASDAEKFMQLFSYDNAKIGENVFSDVKNAIESSTVSAPVVRNTLGIDSETVNGEMMLKASSKLVRVFNGDEKPDDRENMMFKQIVTPEHMLAEAFDKSAREVVSKIRFKLSSPATSTVDDALGAGGVLLGRPIKTFVVSSKASLMPEEYNPMMMHMANHLITPLGEGGVGDTRALNLDTKAVHASHLGFIDPVVSPEGASVGITLAITENAYVDVDGTPAMKVINARNGKEEIVPLDVLWNKKLAYPTSEERVATDGIMVRVGERDFLAKGKKDIDYIMPKTMDMHAPSSNLVPVANSADANRFNMAQKHIQQALSLTAREAPHVSVGTGDGQDYAAKVAVDSGHIPSTKNGGVVIAVKPDHIIVQAKDGTKEKIEYVKDMPLARKTFINHELTVKVGDKLKAGQHIADSNFTKDGNMALGKNVRTAWLSMRGNRNDGVVISESASEMFTSEHMYKENIDVDPTDIQDFKRFLQLFPREVSKWGADNYDARGVIKKGKTLNHHQPMAFIIKKADAKQLKSKLEKVMFTPYKAKIITWHHADEGEVIEANTMGSEIRLNIKVKSPMKVGDKMCYSPDTEVLTSSGWKSVTQVSLDDKLATVNPASLALSYVEPVECMKFYHIGKMYSLETTQISLLVTDNHKNLIKKRGKESYELVEARDHIGKRVKFKKNAIWNGKKNVTKTIPAVEVVAGQSGNGKRTLPPIEMNMEAYLFLMGAYLADGSIVNHVPSGSYGLDITKVKKHKVELLLKEFDKCGINYNITGDKFRIYGKQLMQEFLPLGKSYEKYIPKWIFNLDIESLKILYKWMMWGDGSEIGSSSSYCTTSRRLADDMQKLCLHIGLSANIASREATVGEIKGVEYNFRELYTVSIFSKKNEPTINHGHSKTQGGQTEEMIQYSGDVYCVTMPINNTLYVRRKGKAVWSGNSGRYGNKGVITRIDPDEHMPHDKNGNRVDVTMTAAGVISRTNGGSLIEAGLGKIVEKTGKRYILPHYEKEDNLKFMEDEAKKHGVELYEELINPKTGKPFPGKIFVGNPSMMKLFKDGESGMSAVGVGATDINGQPVKGGSESASSFSNMEANALLAYGANSLLSEAKHIKSQKNDEFFDAFRRGVPTPPPAENFASAKFKSYLEQMAVNVVVNKHTGEYSMIPMDDKEIVKRSSGKVKNADTIYAKNGKPVKGGLFDEVIFGGPSGSRSSHIDLGTKILNPMYKDHVSRMLGVSNADLLSDIEANGIDLVIKKISKIDPKKEIKRLKSEILSSSNPQVANRNIKTIKMLSKTVAIKKKPKDIMFLSKVPVIAPIYRPASKDSNGDISINDLNLHYQDVFAMAEALKHSGSLNKKTALNLKSDLYKSVGALYGTEESPNKKIRDKKIKGVLDILGGDQPKNSYAQQNLLRIKQFMSGRAVIVPARSDISIDQIEIPEAMGLKMYEPHISRRMSRMGFSPMETKELIEAKDPKVLSVMRDIGKQIPLAYNRAPTLWKHGILGGYPVFTKGSVIGVNPLTETALSSDYDGDQIGVHVPVGKAAIEDLKTKMMPSQNLFSDRLSHEAPSLLQLPDQDATLGIYKASIGKKGRNPIIVSSVAKLKEKLRVGEIHYSDYVKVG